MEVLYGYIKIYGCGWKFNICPYDAWSEVGIIIFSPVITRIII